MSFLTTYRLNRARKRRQDWAAFASLIKTPASGTVTLPANGHFAFIATADCPSGTSVASLSGASSKSISSPAMVAGQALNLDYAERGTVVTVHANFAMYAKDGLSVPHKICGGV